MKIKILNKKEFEELQTKINDLEIEILKLNNPSKYKRGQRIKKGKYIITDIDFKKSLYMSLLNIPAKKYYRWEYTAINKKTGEEVVFVGKNILLN